MNVTVYTTPTCPWCHKVKEYLKYKEVRFTEVNVADDREAAMEMIRKTGQTGVPVIDIDGNLVIGFDKARLDALLDR